jgi:hypothetical protein
VYLLPVLAFEPQILADMEKPAKPVQIQLLCLMHSDASFPA